MYLNVEHSFPTIFLTFIWSHLIPRDEEWYVVEFTVIFRLTFLSLKLKALYCCCTLLAEVPVSDMLPWFHLSSRSSSCCSCRWRLSLCWQPFRGWAELWCFQILRICVLPPTHTPHSSSSLCWITRVCHISSHSVTGLEQRFYRWACELCLF